MLDIFKDNIQVYILICPLVDILFRHARGMALVMVIC